MYLPTEHLANSLRCKICQEPLTNRHTCLYLSQPTYEQKSKIAELYYNWNRFHNSTLKEAVSGTNLHSIARNLSYQTDSMQENNH